MAMITLHGLSLSLALTCLAIGCGGPDDGGGPADADLDPGSSMPDLSAPSPAQSAGVFIGVGEFAHDTDGLLYTVNDAIGLAHALIEHRLLFRENVRLLLSGDPSGDSSELYEKMKVLIDSPTRENIERALEAQAAKVGPQGILYVFVATHGFSVDEQLYFMAKNSIPRSRESAVSANTIWKATRASRGQIVLILDTCRVRLPSEEAPRLDQGRESRSPEIRSAVRQFAQTLTSRPAYAVFFATGPDGTAHPDYERQNGFFTGAIVNGLICKDEEATAEPRMVGLAGLASRVQVEVIERSRNVQSAELLTAKGFRDFLLVRCGPIGDILEPVEGGNVIPSGVVRLRARQSGLFAKAVIFAEGNGVYFHQHPEKNFRAIPDRDLRLPVAYGRPDRFQVYVGLGEDPEFLERENEIPLLLETDREGRRIRWLGPVHVTLPKSE